MRMFDRDVEQEEAQAFTSHPMPAVVEQAINTVARRLVLRRAENPHNSEMWAEFAHIGEADWERIQIKAEEIVRELDRGQGPFEAAYELLKRRAERET
jgi:acetolactate synthase small subunit